MNTTLDTRSLTAHDRCDRCGAQAYVRFELNAGGELQFCGHHAKANESALNDVATKVIDNTETLASA